MKSVTVVAVIAISLVISPSLRASSKTDLDRQIQGLNESVSYIRKLIGQDGTDTAREVDAKVQFSVAESIVPFASSGRTTGTPHIQMSTQFRLILVYMAELQMVATADPRLNPCVIEYRMMLETTFAKNITLMGAGQAPLDSPAPEVYAVATEADCRELRALLPIAPEQRGYRDRHVLMAIAFTYLHELGHLALEHLPNEGDATFVGATTDAERMKRFLESMKHSRAQEFQADAWAVREMLQLGAHPLEVLSMPLIDMLLVSSGLDCFVRLGMQHPDVVSRVTAIIQTIRSEHEHRARKALPQQIEEIFSEFVAYNKKVEKTLSCPNSE